MHGSTDRDSSLSKLTLPDSPSESASQRWSTSNGRVWHGVLPALLPWSVSPSTPFATPLVSPVPGHTTIAGLGVAVCLQRGSRDGGRGEEELLFHYVVLPRPA